MAPELAAQLWDRLGSEPAAAVRADPYLAPAFEALARGDWRALSEQGAMRHFVSRTRMTFHRHARRVLGRGCVKVALEFRLDMAQRLLRDTREPVAVIPYAVGYDDLAVIRQAFRRRFGMATRTDARGHPSPERTRCHRGVAPVGSALYSSTAAVAAQAPAQHGGSEMTRRGQNVLTSSFRLGAMALVIAMVAYAVVGGGPARANEPVAGGLQAGSSISVNEPWQYQDTSGNGSAFKWWSQWKVCCWNCGTCTSPCTCGVQYTITFQVKYWIAGNPGQYTLGTIHTDTGQMCTLTNGCAVVTGQAPHTDSLTGTGYGGGSVTVLTSQADCICCCPEGVTIIDHTTCSGDPVTFPFTPTGDGGTDGKVKKEPV